MKNKISIITLVSAIILGLIIIVIVVTNKEEINIQTNNDDNKFIEKIHNDNGAVLEEYKLSGLEEIVFNNISYYYYEPETYIKFNVTNNGDEEITIGYFTVSIRDENDNEMFKMLSMITEPIAPGETLEELEISTVGNYVDGYKLFFEKYEEETIE